ncbi:AraC family transcriptional regulator [Ferruginibacter profundus]
MNVFSFLSMVEIFDDIRKLYRFATPCEALLDYIEFFSETSLDATNQYINTEKFTVKLFPSYTPTIWINLGSPYRLTNGRQQVCIDAHTDILLLRNNIVERTNLRTDNIFTVKFNPGGFEAVFGIEQNKIGNNIINVHTLLPAAFLSALKKLDAFEARIAMLQEYFLHLVQVQFRNKYPYQKVWNAVYAFQQSDMQYNNNKLAGELALTDKTMYRYFISIIGIAPKNYFSIVRTRTALTAYVTNKELFSPYNFGYYDMSHFRKAVAQFTGQPLSQWQS